jgi:4-hydroxybenzoate polyprenyltransferase
VPKLTEKQQKIWQIVLGWVFGFSIWFSLALGAVDPDNALLRWLFLIIFAVAVFGRNQVEKKTGVSMRVFMKHFLISLLVFLGVFLIYGFASGQFNQPLVTG